MQDVQKLRNETKYPPKSQMHKAANYFLNEWDVDWDNNRLERINRHISLSRHNSLFFGSLPESPPGPLGKRIAGHIILLSLFIGYVHAETLTSDAYPPSAQNTTRWPGASALMFLSVLGKLVFINLRRDAPRCRCNGRCLPAE